MSIDLLDPTPLQRKMLQGLYRGPEGWRILAAVSPIGQGKSLGLVVNMMDISLRHKAYREGNRQHMALGYSSGALRRNLESYVVEVAEIMGSHAGYRGGEFPHWEIDGDIKVFLAGGHTQVSHKSRRGASIDSLFVDEVTLVDYQSYDNAVNRMRFDCGSINTTCNADSPDHWFRADILERQGVQLLEADFFDNQHYSSLQREMLLQADPNSSLYRRNILNQWVPLEGLIFPLAPYMIVDDEPQKELVWDEQGNQIGKPRGWVALDTGPGGTTAALLLVPTPYGGLIYDEYYYATQREGGVRFTYPAQDETKHFAAITDKWDVLQFVPDPAAANMRLIAQAKGIPTRLPNNDVEIGIRHTNHLLQRGILKIHQRCRMLRMECASYSYNEVTRKPIKRFDHACDTMRYMAMAAWPPVGGYGFA